MIFSVEASLADWAVEEIFARVKFHVNVEVALVQELFAARQTLESVFRQMFRSMQRHRVVTVEFLLANRARKLFVGVFVFFHVRVKTITFETGKITVNDGTLEGFSNAVNLRHVRNFRRSMNENRVAFFTRPELIGMEKILVFVQANSVSEDFVAFAASNASFVGNFRVFFGEFFSALYAIFVVLSRSNMRRLQMFLIRIFALEREKTNSAREELVGSVDDSVASLFVLLQVVASVEFLLANSAIEL